MSLLVAFWYLHLLAIYPLESFDALVLYEWLIKDQNT
jgi:hypothetical protein